MLLLILLLSCWYSCCWNACCVSARELYIISRWREREIYFSEISTQTMNVSSVKMLDINPHLLTECATFTTSTYVVAISIISGRPYTIYQLDHHGTVIGIQYHDVIGDLTVDKSGILHGVVTDMIGYRIIRVDNNQTLYLAPRYDIIRLATYDSTTDTYYIVIQRWSPTEQYIEMMRGGRIVGMILIGPHQVRRIFITRDTLYVVRINANKHYTQLVEINIEHQWQRVLVNYTNYGGTRGAILINDELHVVMLCNSFCDDTYWVITNIRTLNWTAHRLPLYNEILCIIA